MNISATTTTPMPTLRAPRTVDSQHAKLQREAELIVEDVRGFFSDLGVKPSEGNDDRARVLHAPKFPNAAFGRSERGTEFIAIGTDAQTGASYTVAKDVVAHEWAHRVVDTITNNSLSHDPFHPDTAVSESLADTFAAVYDRDDWTIGEDLGRPIRDMANPGALGEPGSMSDVVPLARAGKIPAKMVAGPDGRKQLSVEAHALAGIPNRAASIIGDSLGRDTMAEIYLKTTREHVRPGGGLTGLAVGTMKAARDLFGSGSNELQVTRDAWDAVGLLDLVKASAARRA